MVAMFMSDQNRIKAAAVLTRRCFTDQAQAPFEFLKAQSGVDEDTRPVRGDERRRSPNYRSPGRRTLRYNLLLDVSLYHHSTANAPLSGNIFFT